MTRWMFIRITNSSSVQTIQGRTSQFWTLTRQRQTQKWSPNAECWTRISLTRRRFQLVGKKIANASNISHTIVQRILEDDLKRVWIKTKWVPHTLTEANKVIRVQRCVDLFVAFSSRLCKSNLVTMDEKMFYSRILMARHTIGSWLDPAGDEAPLQTARRNAMEKKVHEIIAVSCRRGHHFSKFWQETRT